MRPRTAAHPIAAPPAVQTGQRAAPSALPLPRRAGYIQCTPPARRDRCRTHAISTPQTPSRGIRSRTLPRREARGIQSGKPHPGGRALRRRRSTARCAHTRFANPPAQHNRHCRGHKGQGEQLPIRPGHPAEPPQCCQGSKHGAPRIHRTVESKDASALPLRSHRCQQGIPRRRPQRFAQPVQ